MKKKKVMGSDFTYEDQSGGRASEKFTGTLLREEEADGVACYVLDLKPTPKGPSYSKVAAWIGKEDFVMRRADFYQNGEEAPFKRLIAEDVRPVGEKRVPHKLTMTNLEDRSTTVNVTTRIQLGVEIPESIFESRNLDS